MRGLAIGSALALILILVPGSRFLLVLLIPLAFFALLRYRARWQPLSRTIAPTTSPHSPAANRTPDHRRRRGQRDETGHVRTAPGARVPSPHR